MCQVKSSYNPDLRENAKESACLSRVGCDRIARETECLTEKQINTEMSTGALIEQVQVSYRLCVFLWLSEWSRRTLGVRSQTSL